MLDNVSDKIKFILSSISKVYDSQLKLAGEGYIIEKSIIKLDNVWESTVIASLLSQVGKVISGYGAKSTLTKAIEVHEFTEQLGVSSKLMLTNLDFLKSLLPSDVNVQYDENNFAGTFWGIKTILSDYIPKDSFILFPDNVGVSIEESDEGILLTLAYKDCYAPIVCGCVNYDVETINKE